MDEACDQFLVRGINSSGVTDVPTNSARFSRCRFYISCICIERQQPAVKNIARVFRSIAFPTFIVMASSCASIPTEAPELSIQLGSRIASLESAHYRLLEDFFDEKRNRIDLFIQNVWVPEFADEFFSQSDVAAVWNQIVADNEPAENIKFVTLVGPRLQAKINSERLKIVQPLDELESVVKNKLKAEYDGAKAINNAITSFLLTSSDLDQNRKRYLDLIGIRDEEINSAIADTEKVVSDLLVAAKNFDTRVKDVEAFKEEVKAITEKLRSGS